MRGTFSLKAELHVHSHIGHCPRYCPFIYDSVQSVEEILTRARELDIRILSITDHNSLEGYRRAKKAIQRSRSSILLVPGCEISSKDGHILAYNIKREIAEGLSAQETIDEIHRQGGIAVAAHPYNPFFSLRDKVFSLDLDAIEGYNSGTFSSRSIAKAVAAAEKLGIPCTAGSDAHQVEEIGKGVVLFPPSTRGCSDVIENIRRGNFEVAFTRSSGILKVGARHIWRNLKLRLRD